eukprot:14183431-Alexandrium_andersonii.AAC.1
MPKGDVRGFVTDIAGHVGLYSLRAVLRRGGLRFVEGEAHEVADALDVGYDGAVCDWCQAARA